MVAQGTTLAGRYRLDTRIGAGGMGEVWRGEDIVLARTVAVKVLLPGRMEDPGFVARFQGEARAMATINHAGVVDVYDYGVSGDTVYLVMKFVDGEPLDRLLSRLGRIPPQAAMELIAQAASALQAVHDQGIVHRDVKPGNLLVQRDGTLVLTDFGIARSDLANRLTDAGMVLGTAAYCAPEQAEGAPVTPAVDIYALGVVAYECLVGQRPFDGDSAVTIALKHIREAPPPLPPDIPQAVRTLVEIALSKDPARRYPTAKAMSEAARAIARGQAPEPVQPPVTGATMVPPADYPAHQTGQYAAGPHQTGQYAAGPHQTGQSDADPYRTGVRMAGPEETTVAERRGRRAAKAPRRTGLIAGIAAVVVLGAGATAVALTGMTTGDPTPTNTAAPAAKESTPKNTPKPSTTKPKPKTTPTPDSRPTTNRPRPTKTEKEETPTPTPSKTPTSTPSKTPSGTPTPTVKKVLVPKVVGMPFLKGQEMVEAAGFVTRVIDSTSTTDGMRCGKIQKTNPAGGTAYDVTKPVSLVVIDGVCSTPSATPGATATPK
ncbi:serine/threonine-protein kinase [Nonomuraea turcica]|uniref:serine/threonine-protein kinase n=1 Tax=Nonomuraea sp. G32 TaxID=3067274 RepID=UPI00273CF4CF|nr:serine/threonine-protein kinase [Nonomuraea sp. G32]MDP4511433.1 protein kinase [Nonomuraea sp. G32]